MAAGSQTSVEGASAGGGGGMGLISSLFGGGGGGAQAGGGFTSQEGMSQYITPGGQTIPPGQSSTLWQQLGQIIQDPEVLKALGDTTKQLGNTVNAANKIPPHATQLLQNAMAQGGQNPKSKDFLGDAEFFSPDMATSVLNGLGINGSFNSAKPAMGGMQLAEADSPQARRIQQMQEQRMQEMQSQRRRAGAAARPGASSGGGGFQGASAGQPPPAAEVVRPSAPLTAGQAGGTVGGRQAGHWEMGPDGQPQFIPD